MNIEISTTNSIEETNFQEGLQKKEKKHLHRSIILSYLLRKYNCETSDIVFDDCHGRIIDDVLKYNNSLYSFEYKTDYRAGSTKNIVFELVPYILSPYFPREIVKTRYSKDDTNFPLLLSIIDKSKNMPIGQAKISSHLNPFPFQYFFTYAVSKAPYANETNDATDINEYLVFGGSIVSDFVKKNYKNGDLIVTKTRRDNVVWFTISWLVNKHWAKTMCKPVDILNK